MGNSFRKRPPVVIVLGLDDAGKTSCISSLQKKSIDTVLTPTVHSPLENLVIKNKKMMAWDLGGKDKVRNLWRHYYVGSDAVLFVIDSSNRERLQESKQELIKLLNEPLLKDVVFMILCNKSDIANSMTTQEIEDQLQIESNLPPPQNSNDLNKRIKVQSTSALLNENIQDSFIWILDQIKDKKRNDKKKKGNLTV